MKRIRRDWPQLVALVLVACSWGHAAADRAALRRDIERLYSLAAITAKVDMGNHNSDYPSIYRGIPHETKAMPSMFSVTPRPESGRPILFGRMQAASVSLTPASTDGYDKTRNP